MLDEVKCCSGPGYASPQEALKAPKEKVATQYASILEVILKTDYLATIDVDIESPTMAKLYVELNLEIGDELHHMGWNACSSCHDDEKMQRKYLIIPGLQSSNFYIVDTATDSKKPTLYKTISGEEIKQKTNLSSHTVHCLGSEIIVSMLGDANGNAPGDFFI